MDGTDHLFDGAGICVKCNRCRHSECADERCHQGGGCDNVGGEFDRAFGERLARRSASFTTAEEDA